MQLYFLVGIGWSRDANGNLQATDSAGNVLEKFVNGASSAQGNISAIGLGTGRTTTTQSITSTGYGTSLTPLVSTRIMIQMSFVYTDTTTADVAPTYYLYYNTTGVPAANATVGSDSQVLPGIATNSSSAAFLTLTTLIAVLTGLTVGTKYYIYAAFKTVGTDTTEFQGISMALQEI